MSRHFLKSALRNYLHRFKKPEEEDATTNWYEISSPVLAYQPIGAASYADSKVNLANPGTYNAIDIVAPSWSSVDGWTFTGSESLNTGLAPATDGTWSMLIRYSDISVADEGALVGLLSTARFMVNAKNDGTFNVANGDTSSYINVSAGTSGVIGFSGKSVYVDGSNVATIPAGTAVNTTSLWVGNWRTSALFLTGKLQCIGIWDSTLTPAQAAEISTKMAAL